MYISIYIIIKKKCINYFIYRIKITELLLDTDRIKALKLINPSI